MSRPRAVGERLEHAQQRRVARDRELVQLIAQRTEVARRIGRIKGARALPVRAANARLLSRHVGAPVRSAACATERAASACMGARACERCVSAQQRVPI